jgi:hypothetical protein
MPVVKILAKSKYVSDETVKVKLFLYRYALCRRQGGRLYSSYSFLTSALDGVGGQLQAPVALYTPGKEPRYPLDRRLGWPQSRSAHRG